MAIGLVALRCIHRDFKVFVASNFVIMMSVSGAATHCLCMRDMKEFQVVEVGSIVGR